jgi:hypothetical protein
MTGLISWDMGLMVGREKVMLAGRETKQPEPDSDPGRHYRGLYNDD